MNTQIDIRKRKFAFMFYYHAMFFFYFGLKLQCLSGYLRFIKWSANTFVACRFPTYLPTLHHHHHTGRVLLLLLLWIINSSPFKIILKTANENYQHLTTLYMILIASLMWSSLQVIASHIRLLFFIFYGEEMKIWQFASKCVSSWS